MTRTKINASGAALWASAFVLAALVIVQAGRYPGKAAQAEMTATRGSYTILTTDAGRGGDTNPWELLYLIDSRDQILLVYEIEDARQNTMHLRDGASLEYLFRVARPRP
jgi:hypothetical protein